MGPSSDANRFIGRTGELARIASRFEDGDRLVTLVGPGGIGKTRLALQHARTLPGAVVCDLSERASSDEICFAVARALGAEGANGNADAVGHALATRGAIFLVLDGFERGVAAAAETLGRWLEIAPAFRALVTSRERLRLGGETVLEVGPLGEAEALFAARARAVAGEDILAESDAPIVSEIVRRLDGIPLAIELAAARLRVLAPQTLLDALSNRFEILAGGPRDARAHQRTMRAAIDWSWELLGDWERAALAQCAVFRGGFTFEAAEAVLDLGAFPDAPAALDAVAALRDKSLIFSGAGRFRLYESIREYAGEKLAASGSERAAWNRHADFFSRHGAAYAEAARGPDAADALETLALEQENLAVIVERGIPSLALEAALALEPLLTARGPLGRLLALLDRALDSSPGATDSLLATAHAARGASRAVVGRLAEARADLDRSAMLAPSTGDVRLEALVASESGALAIRERRRDEAGLAFDAALGLFEAAGDRRGMALAQIQVGNLHHDAGRFDEARGGYERALVLLRDAPDRSLEARAVGNLAAALLDAGDPVEARVLLDRALVLAQGLGHALHEAYALGHLAALLHEEGRLGEALALYTRGTDLALGSGDLRAASFFLRYAGVLHQEEGRLGEAAAAYERALGFVRTMGHAPYEGITLGHFATVQAGEGRSARATATLEDAERLVGPDPRFRAVIALQRGHIDLCQAREAAAAADPEAARAALRRAEARIAPNGDGPARAGLPADPEVRFALRTLARALEGFSAEPPRAHADEEPADGALVVGPEGRWLRLPDGKRVEVVQRPVRRVALRLAQARLSSPGEGLSPETLLAAGWPGERVGREAGANRVYVAVATLRQLGLREVLVRRRDGYLLDPARALRISDLRKS